MKLILLPHSILHQLILGIKTPSEAVCGSHNGAYIWFLLCEPRCIYPIKQKHSVQLNHWNCETQTQINNRHQVIWGHSDAILVELLVERFVIVQETPNEPSVIVGLQYTSIKIKMFPVVRKNFLEQL